MKCQSNDSKNLQNFKPQFIAKTCIFFSEMTSNLLCGFTFSKHFTTTRKLYFALWKIKIVMLETIFESSIFLSLSSHHVFWSSIYNKNKIIILLQYIMKRLDILQIVRSNEGLRIKLLYTANLKWHRGHGFCKLLTFTVSQTQLQNLGNVETS